MPEALRWAEVAGEELEVLAVGNWAVVAWVHVAWEVGVHVRPC